jgi:hypothetical protein
VEQAPFWRDTAEQLSGSAKRMFMAKVVNLIGYGGQRLAERVLGWNRCTIRKGQLELDSGPIADKRKGNSGRKPIDQKLPELDNDIRSILEPTGQTDPTFRSTRIYTPMTARQVHKRLKKTGRYTRKTLPSRRTISTRMTVLGYRPQKVRKCLPLKKIPETDAIFRNVDRMNAEADADPNCLRISLDTKATVAIGAFSRGGYNRCGVKAQDHDFDPEVKLAPFGMLLPETGESYLWFTKSKVTADFMVDRLEEIWPELARKYGVNKLVINADNGPECSGRRTQWLKRLTDFSERGNVEVRLVYYPPYHSKYNPVERLWGVLENHWRGELINSVQKALGLARSMTYKKIRPVVVKLVRKIYRSGVTIKKKAMLAIEEKLERKKGLESWSIRISPQAQLG